MDSVSDSAMHQDRREGGGYRRIELITGAARRRRWTAEEKAALVAESLQPGINVSELARRRGINRGLLQTWRRTAMREAAESVGAFVPLRIEDGPVPAEAARPVSATPSASAAASSAAAETGVLEIESGRLRVRFSGPVDAAALKAVLAQVGRRA
jgi:transposase